ncbi:uncharacterized protein BO95DRAFT_89157 [Aspergillus brunneoviolaceus CBS 621.78]|uniref:Uncharacterized protein n=1 Tax=Aspergillus brunneoviolaceus CBS 621.78 TaxID=1450534 RepID=A0ACD1GCZ2_9EURO|nr:hypothetical protein BO95DRAFT_89157 [Aspergillus brunneoviolaceus CBS 621.78]RAH47028.1 hypothetical protein BO95DRAFT_89157 [Aspergillus brunneoviolaceus CBS 621.78]
MHAGLLGLIWILKLAIRILDKVKENLDQHDLYEHDFMMMMMMMMRKTRAGLWKTTGYGGVGLETATTGVQLVPVCAWRCLSVPVSLPSLPRINLKWAENSPTALLNSTSSGLVRGIHHNCTVRYKPDLFPRDFSVGQTWVPAIQRLSFFLSLTRVTTYSVLCTDSRQSNLPNG